MNVKGKNALGTVDVPFDTLVKYRSMLVETANNIEAFVKKQLNPLLGTEKLMNEITADEKEQQEDFDAIYDKKEHGFVCNYEGCSEGLFFEIVEIVEHLKDKHGLEPDDQMIDGWTDKHEQIWTKAQKKKSKNSGKSLPVRWNYSEDGLNDMNMGELWNIARKLGLSRKGKKDILIQRILKEQKGGQEKPIKRIPLTELQKIAPPSFYTTTRRITPCPKNCPNLTQQNKCTNETCIIKDKNRPTFKEIYCVIRKT